MWKRILSVTAVLAFVSTASATGQAIKPGKNYASPPKSITDPAVQDAPMAEKRPAIFSLSRGIEKLNRRNRVIGEKVLIDSIYFYNSVDYLALGLSGGGTFKAAIRLTPDELAPYSGYAISQVYFYHHEATTNSGNVIIYGQGTPTSPGNILETVPYTADSVGWVLISLPNIILISGENDIWVAVEITHVSGEHPISIDQGPAVAGKGDWFYADIMDTMWHELSEFNLSYNWNIGVIVEPYGDVLDPLPPSNVSTYSDYTMPSEIDLSWVDPTHYVNGDTLTDFHIEIWMSSETKDTVFLDTVSAGVQQYTATGLTDGTLYTFYLRTVDVNDSTSDFASASWYAGGSPYPAPPHNLTATVLDDSTVELTWINPSTQADGTPLDDMAGINIYVDGELTETYATSDAGALITYDITVTIGRHTFYVTAVDNESPQHESDPSNEVEVITSVHVGGPDGYGYTFVDSDHPNGPAFDWIDASAGIPYNLGDDANVLIQLPFPFPFYDQTLTEIYIVSNGFLTSSSTTDYGNDPLPDGSKNNIIAPFWDDLNPRAEGTIHTYFDTLNNTFVVEWDRFTHYASSHSFYTFEVIFYPNGDLKFQYLDMDENLVNSSTIGIQGGHGSNDFYLQYTYNGDPVEPHDSLAIMWIYPHRKHDVGIFAVQEPVFGGYVVGDEITPQVTVINNGQNEESFDVTAMIYYADTLVYTSTATVNNLNSGEVTNLAFHPFTIPYDGRYNFITYTLLPGDTTSYNDTAEVQFYGLGYSNNFEANNGFYSPYPDSGAWEWGTPTYGPSTAHSGSKLWGTVLNGYYRNSACYWELYSVDYIATSDNPIFSFWQWYIIQFHRDGGNVSISTDNGATWTIIEPVGGYDDNSVNGLDGRPGFTGSSGGWVQAIFNLDGITTGTIFKIRFRFGSDGAIRYPGWYIDDVGGTGLRPYPSYDAAAVNIEAPYGSVIADSEVVPMGTVRNSGAYDGTFDVVLTIDSLGKSIIYADTQTVTLAARAETTVSFAPWIPQGSLGDTFNVTLRVLLVGDEIPDNDEYTTTAWISEIIEIPATNTPPVLDGVIDTASGEWEDALIIDVGDTLGISPPAQPAGANLMYIMRDNDYVYFAFDISTDTIFTDRDQIGIYLDDNADNTWSADSTEGNNNIFPNPHIGWASRVITPGPTFGNWRYPRNDRTDCYAISSTPGHIVYEIKLPYGIETTPDPAFLGINRSSTFGILVMYLDETSGDYQIWWPQHVPLDEFANPVFYQKMTLGVMSVAEGDVPKRLSYSLNIQHNPIYKTGVLNFTLPKLSDVEITLYDATGRMVSKLASGRFSAGSHTVRLNASKLTNGVYFVHMKSNDFNTVKKVIVLR